MNGEVERMQVVIEADNRKLKETAQESKKVIHELSEETDRSMGKMKETAQESKKAIRELSEETDRSLREINTSPPLGTNWGKQIDAARASLEATTSKTASLREQIRKFNIEAQTRAGLIKPTEEYTKVTSDIKAARSELERLLELEKNFSEDEKYDESKRFKDLQAAEAGCVKQLEELEEKLDGVSNAGKRVVNTPEYDAVRKQYEDAKKRSKELKALREKEEREWAKIGYKPQTVFAQTETVPLNEQRMSSITRSIQEVTDEINHLQSEMRALEDIGADSKESEEAAELASEIARVTENLNKYRAEQAAMKADGSWMSETEGYSKVVSEIQQATAELNDYRAKKRALEGSGKDYVPTQRQGLSAGNDFEKMNAQVKELRRRLKETQREIEEMVRKVPVLGRALSNAAYVGKKGFSGLKAVSKTVTSAIKKASGTAASLIKRFASGIPILKRFTSESNNTGSSGNRLGGIFRSIGTAAKFMLSSMLISNGINAMKTGMTSLAQHSTTTNSNLSLLKSQLTQVQGALAAAFEPVLNVVTPVLSTLIDYLLAACNAVAQFMAALTGQDTYNVAQRAASGFAASADGAAQSASNAASEAENLKRTLMGFDQINKLEDTSSSGGGGSGGGGSGSGSGSGAGFVTTPVENQFSQLADKIKQSWKDADFTEIGTMIGEKLTSALESINWDGIKETADKIAKSIATFLNGAVSGIDWSVVGKTLGEGLNTALSFLNTFWETFDWKETAKGIFTALYSAIDTLDFGEIGSAFSNITKAFFDTISGALQGIDWKDLPSLVIRKIVDFFSGFDYAGSFASVGTLIGTAFASAIDLVKGLADVLGDIGTTVKNYFVEKFEDAGFDEDAGFAENGKAIITGLLNGIVDAIKDIGSWVKENIFDPFIDGFKNAFGIHSPSTVMAEQGGHVIDGLLNGMLNAVTGIKDWITKNILTPITSALDTVIEIGVSLAKSGWDTVTGWLSNLGSAAKGAINTAVSLAKSGWSTVTGWLSNLGTAAKGAINTAVSLAKSGWDTVTGWLSNLGSAAKGAIDTAVSLAKDGWNTVQGWLSGLGDTAKGIVGAYVSLQKKNWNTVQGWLSNLGDVAKGAIDTAVSLAKDGWNTVQGWLSGLGDAAKGVLSAGVEIVNKASEWWSSVQQFWTEHTKNKHLQAYIEANPLPEDGETPEGEAYYEYEVNITADNTDLKEKVDESADYLSETLPNETSVDLEMDTSSAEKSRDDFTTETGNQTLTSKFDVDTTKATGTRTAYGTTVAGVTLTSGFNVNTSKATATRKAYATAVEKGTVKTQLGVSTTSKDFKDVIRGKVKDWSLGVGSHVSTGSTTFRSGIGKLTRGWSLGVGSYVNTGAGTFRNGIGNLTYGWKLGVDTKVKTSFSFFRKLIKALVENWSLSVTAKITTVKIDYVPVINVKGRITDSYQAANGGVYKNGYWQPVTAAASGGAFSTGQFFLAREAGPELVGTIGGSTAVMNNDQIVSSVSAGVYAAVCAAMAQGSGKTSRPVFNIYVGGKRITDVVIEEVNNRTMITGQCPILT